LRCIVSKDLFHLGILPGKIEGTEGVIRGDRRTDNTMVERIRTNNDVQSTAQKTKD